MSRSRDPGSLLDTQSGNAGFDRFCRFGVLGYIRHRMSIYEKFQPIDLANIHTYELASRPSKVTVEDFAEPVKADDSLRGFLDKLPDILAVRSMREVAAAIVRARDKGKPIIWGIGGHVVKT